MQKLSTLSKIFSVLSLMSASIWIGSYLSRLFLIYRIFEGPDLVVKSFINDSNIEGILFAIMPAIVVHFLAFIFMIVATILFFVTSKINLRNNGWLFIILVAVIITMPFEVYLMSIDLKVILMLQSSSFDSNVIISLLRDRIKELSSYSIVAILTYLSFYYFIVFQPLTKKD
ncbi:MAG TPA: hypothetical protein DHV28_09130 [Ignavibacteriales bacterium]|nr:hypothetical protein [Ignavibacteriales bacterium]